MDLKKVSQNQNQVTPDVSRPKVDKSGGPSFAEALGQVSGQKNIQKPDLQALQSVLGASDVQPADPLKFSNHAVERMMSRGIQFNKDEMAKLNDAVARAAAKGSKDSLILMNDSALIVSVKNKTVVTVMDKNALKENVFTNIDSTIVM